MLFHIAVAVLLTATNALAQSPPAALPLAQRCPGRESATNVACVNKYAAVMPPTFDRARSDMGQDLPDDTFPMTQVQDPSFGLVHDAQFIVFDAQRGGEILGSSPMLEHIFDTRNDSIHEAPVYVPGLNAIIFSLPHEGIYDQQIINLNSTPPTLANYTTTPPVYAVNGGKYHKGTVYWGVEASYSFPSPVDGTIINQRPGLCALDPATGNVTTLLNNYFGTQFNSINDLFIDAIGDIWFTDSWYGYAINVTDLPVQPPLTWRFRPSTGRASVVETSLQQPNGIGISPNGRTLYLTDTGVTDFSMPPPPSMPIPKYSFNPRLGRTIYAFDVVSQPAGAYLTNKRPIYQASQFADDGFHVAANGYLVGAEGTSVSILSPEGELLVSIQTDFVVNNIQFAGANLTDLWLFGMGGISKATLALQGMANE